MHLEGVLAVRHFVSSMIGLNFDMSELKNFADGLQNRMRKVEENATEATLKKILPIAQDAARRQMEKDLDDPLPTTLDAIRTKLERSGNGYRGKVYIKREYVRALYPNIFGMIEEDASGGIDIITPVNITVDAAGNIPGLSSGALTTLRLNTDEYLNVPLGESASYNNLPSGLYQKFRTTGQRNTRLVMLLRYDYRRVIEPKYKYFESVRRVIERDFVRCMAAEFVDEFKRQ